MNLTIAQRGVARAMAAGLAVALAGFGLTLLAGTADAWSGMPASPLHAVALASLAPTVTLAICIARLAAHRFRTPEDINGSGLVSGTETARLLQAQLQNTLEQVVLALPVYAACGLLWPQGRDVALTASVLFFCGRVFFFRGYRHGAVARAFGFALTFYPTVLLLTGLIIHAALSR